MRKLPLFALAAVATLTFAGATQALPVSGAASIAATTATIADHSSPAATEVQYRHGRYWRGHRDWRVRRDWRHRQWRAHRWHRRHWR